MASSSPISAKGFEAQLANLEKSVGNKGAPKLHIFSKQPKIMGDVMSFGIPEFDEASNMGGHYRGACIELYGQEAGGKTYAAMKTAAAYQRAGFRVAWIDPEHSFVPDWAVQAGVDLEGDMFLYGDEFDHGEEALMYILEVCKKQAAGLVVLDSVTALLPKAEVNGTFADNYMATHARMMSQSVKHIVDAGWRGRVTQMFINQIRTKPGVMFGNPEDTPGGKALKYYAHQRIDVRRKEIMRAGTGEDSKSIGISSKVTFSKNRFGPPFGTSLFSIHFSQETNSPLIQLIQLAAKLKLLPNRKTVENKKYYVWGKGKDSEMSDATSIPDFAAWLDMEGHIPELLEQVVTANNAEEKKIVLSEEILALAVREGVIPAEKIKDEGEDEE